MVIGDTSHVPLFERGYRDRMLALRHTRNVYTSLDANQERLSSGFVDNPALVNAQFLIFQFTSFDQLVELGNLFVQSEGYPPRHHRRSHPTTHRRLAAEFPIGGRPRLVPDLLAGPSRRAVPVLPGLLDGRASVAREYSAGGGYAFGSTPIAQSSRGFLRPERLGDGSFILSLPLGGEGRSVTDPQLGNAVAVLFPTTPATAIEAVYAFAHEVTDNVTNLAFTANARTTDRRAVPPPPGTPSIAQLYGATADVRAGALLLQRIAPELVQGTCDTIWRRSKRPFQRVTSPPPLPPHFRFPTPFEMGSSISSDSYSVGSRRSAPCHSERSEESVCSRHEQILRFAQDDTL